MGLSGEAELLSRVRENVRYVREYQRLTGAESPMPTAAFIVQTLAAYERSLEPRTTPMDGYFAGNERALSAEAKAGLTLFQGRAGCSACHRLDAEDTSLTDNQFHETSTGMRGAGKRFPALALNLTRLSLKERLDLIPIDSHVAALGRFVVTLDPKDIGFFRTPSLREAKLTAPYMHDGSVPSLQEAVDVELYYRGLQQGYPVNFSLAERREIRLFIESATAPVSSNERLASQHSATFTVSTRHE
jgi:cytochrome c peroxidase